ncbi:hypothetical protein ACAW74_22885 [Fibrella sp. WM1]|uniref:hypothetical protein n=1 Tax=Fibrella musci TaxID=3242485 RepID=UPI0035204171
MHNEKSLKPLGQIYLIDSTRYVSVQLLNNGLGPLIIDRLAFKVGNTIYSSIRDCLTFDPKSYMHGSSEDVVQKVILPNAALTVFEATLKAGESENNLDQIRKQLALITVIAHCRDIYDNKIILERSSRWFVRHMLEAAIES